VETALIDRWLGAPDVLVVDEAAVAVARERVRAVGAGAGLSHELVETTALIASELLMNQLRHAAGGRFAVRVLERDDGVAAGLEVIAADRGPGLSDPAAALAGRKTRAGAGAESGAAAAAGGSLGAGVAAVFRLADEVDVDVRVGEGTCFRARTLVTSPRQRAEVAIYGTACPGERVAGDDAAFVRTPGGVLLIAVADGLGHGPEARRAAAQAVAAACAVEDISEMLREADRTLARARCATPAPATS
jgi:anti-sigma regulatory factor (Ser/Thr protein kinase)